MSIVPEDVTVLCQLYAETHITAYAINPTDTNLLSKKIVLDKNGIAMLHFLLDL